MEFAVEKCHWGQVFLREFCLPSANYSSAPYSIHICPEGLLQFAHLWPDCKGSQRHPTPLQEVDSGRCPLCLGTEDELHILLKCFETTV
jgi:hypothetical protein